MRDKDALIEEMTSIGNKIEELENQLESLSEKRDQLEQQIKEYEANEETAGILGKIRDVSSTNSYRVKLKSSTKTVPIMDEFRNPKWDFLLIERALFLGSSYNCISLVIAKSIGTDDDKDDVLTMTNLKGLPRKYLYGDFINDYQENSREYPLIHELYNISKRKLQPGEKIPFSVPCLLGGQNSINRTGYGSEYCGYDQVWEGTKYGETTKFYIIGILVED